MIDCKQVKSSMGIDTVSRELGVNDYDDVISDVLAATTTTVLFI